ncbi:Rpn family recombination-promoting nuclease/putative transposase [Acetobacterium sp.]|jgi:predicted transposase/invertase (TIGR01784 family)|uniref:Rpn family recombination-promoting nuclease/putative transposase n=1 Tax=Acetobacterium sp. TaxID=1872094 RepID=UPI000CBD5BA7|nr:Rpn family recombination-promoting nuclease/putative transposase [Acetobacterium sp.]MDO9492910.1 Rpn family recombination-promoting nuclease/putative transposase [Acetobacterium sp.]PKM75523.1 MAG: transposase [Firmicutes bacterium HGW-Firmicutes-17]
MKIKQIHDKFFRATFANLEVSQNFLKESLPESILKTIDLQNLELQNGTHISKELEETRSDLLFRTTINQQEGYLYLLFEHKSYLDKNVGLQLLTYLVNIWNQKIKNEKSKHIPVIIPMVIYHGKRNWELGNSLDTMILGYDDLPDDIKKGIPNFSYHVYDLNRFSDEVIVMGSLYYVVLSILKHVNRHDEQALLEALKRVAAALNAMNEKQTATEYFETCLRYVYEIVPEFSNVNSNVVQKYIEGIFPEGSEVAMTLAEVLREEGFEKGIQKGIEKGKKEGVEEGLEKGIEAMSSLAINRLSSKFGIMPAEYQEKIAALDLKMLELLNYEIDRFTSIDDVKKFLGI